MRFAERLIAIFEDEVAQLEGLEPPAGTEAAFERYLDARADAIGHLEDGLQAAEANDPEGYADAQAEAAEGQVERADLAQQAGLNECSRPLAGDPGGGTP